MGFLSHRGPGTTAGFLSTLDKLGQAIDPKILHERLRLGTGPWFGVGGLATGLALGSRVARKMGPKAFWPITIMTAMAGLEGAELLRRAYEGPYREEERLLEAIRASRIPTATSMAAVPTGTVIKAP